MTEPLVPAEVNLRGLPWMRLDTIRLLDSDLFAMSTGDEFKAAVALWCKSWSQIPGGSLPTEDRVLAHLSGAGAKWKRVNTMALRGWIECADGRLYHPVVAEQAIAAWEERQEFRAEVESTNERKRRERDERKGMFATLKDAGHTLAWNTPTGILRDLVRDLSHQPATDCVTDGVTGHGDSHGLDGTGRDGSKSFSPSNHASTDGSKGSADDLARALRGVGFPECSGALPDLIEAKREGVTAPEIAAVATIHAGKPLAYIVQAARGKRADARSRAASKGEAVPITVDPQIRAEADARHRLEDLVLMARSDFDHELIDAETRDQRIAAATAAFREQFPGPGRVPAAVAEGAAA